MKKIMMQPLGLVVAILGLSSVANAYTFKYADIGAWSAPNAQGEQFAQITFNGSEAIDAGSAIWGVSCYVNDDYPEQAGEPDPFRVHRMHLITDAGPAGTDFEASIPDYSYPPLLMSTDFFNDFGQPLITESNNQITAELRRVSPLQTVSSCFASWAVACTTSTCAAPDFCSSNSEDCIEDSAANSIMSYDFNVAENNDLNGPYAGTPWTVSEGVVRDDHVKIRGNRIDHHYFRWEAPLAQEVLPTLYNNYNETTIDDGVLMFTGRGLNNNYMSNGRRFGVSYRLTDDDGDYCSDGYHVLVHADGVELTKNCNEIVGSWSGTVDSTMHDYAVEFDGGRHAVFMDGELIIYEVDFEYNSAGYVGMSSYYSVSFLDDFRVLNAVD